MPFGLRVQVLVKSAPALAVGMVRLTVTITWSVAVHPLEVFVAVKVYVVVAVGLAVGLAADEELKSLVGDQE